MIKPIDLFQQLAAAGAKPSDLERHKFVLIDIAANAPYIANVAGWNEQYFGLIWTNGDKHIHFTFPRLAGDPKFDAFSDDGNPDNAMNGRLTKGSTIALFAWTFADELQKAEDARIKREKFNASILGRVWALALLKFVYLKTLIEKGNATDDEITASDVEKLLPGQAMGKSEILQERVRRNRERDSMAISPTMKVTMPPLPEGADGWMSKTGEIITPTKPNA